MSFQRVVLFNAFKMRLLFVAVLVCMHAVRAEIVYVRSDAQWLDFKAKHSDAATVVLFDEDHPTSLIQLHKLKRTFSSKSPGVVLAAVHAPDVSEFKNAPMPHSFHLGLERRRRLGSVGAIVPWGSVDERKMPEHLLVFINAHARDEVLKAVRESAEMYPQLPHVVVSLATQSHERIVKHFAVAHGPEHQAFRITRADVPSETDVVQQLKFTTAKEFVDARERLVNV